MFLRRSVADLSLLVLLLALLSWAPVSRGQPGKGNQILLNRGLQLQGLSQDDCYLHLDTFSNANYTAIHWINSVGPAHSSRPEWMGPPPGFPWARWAGDETQMPPQSSTPYDGDETPYLGQLLALQLGDEWNLNDDATRTRLVNWFDSVRSNWPNVMLYHNNWGSQIGDAQLADFYTRAHPDLLCFDTYPWQSVYDTGQPNNIGAPIPGPPTGWYGDLRRYREHARGASIPLALYRQTFHAVQDYDQHVFRDPSPSELRLNTFGALAFNAKMLIDFVYNTGAASLFTKTFNGSGDTLISSNGLYAEMADVNRRAQNLGKALAGLKPVYDLHNANPALYPNGFPPGPVSDNPNFPPGYTTSIMFLRGKYISGGVTNFTAVPNSFIADPDVASSNPAGTGQAYTWWEAGKNDPYLRGWVVTNKAAIKNNGLLGDAILAWFTPLDENLDGTNYNNEIYMMAVNGLTDPTGAAADCLQQIRLNFLDTTATASVLMLDPTTGKVTTNALPLVSTRRQLAVDLNGGDAILFKFNTGAPFVGFVQPAAARLTVQKPARGISLSLDGTLGARYLLQSASSLSTPTWMTLTNTVLVSSPFVFQDNPAPTDSARYYRAVGVQP
jgi:hypothetical protein